MFAFKTFYRANKVAVLAGVGLFILYRFWGFFSGLFGILTPGNGPGLFGAVATGLEDMKAAAEVSHDVKITKGIAPGMPAAVLNQARQDADSLAVALKEKGSLANIFSPDKDAAYRIIKPYARVLFGTGGKVAVTRGVPHLRNPARTMRILQPFYYEITEGRNLLVDLDATFSGNSAMDSFYKQYIRIK